MRALALVLLLCLSASTAHAGFPWWPANSTIPANIHLVAWNGTAPDTTFGRFVVTVRDLANNPLAGARVDVDFSAMTGVRLAADQLDSAVQTRCLAQVVSRLTESDGTAAFTIMGSTNSLAAAAGAFTVKIYADGVLLGSPLLSAFDLDGAVGIGANDVSLWLGDFGTQQYHGRGDYDGNGTISANDLSILVSALGAGGSSVSIATLCP